MDLYRLGSTDKHRDRMRALVQVDLPTSTALTHTYPHLPALTALHALTHHYPHLSPKAAHCPPASTRTGISTLVQFDSPTITGLANTDPHLPALYRTYPHLPALTHTKPHLPTFTHTQIFQQTAVTLHTYPHLATRSQTHPQVAG